MISIGTTGCSKVKQLRDCLRLFLVGKNGGVDGAVSALHSGLSSGLIALSDTTNICVESGHVPDAGTSRSRTSSQSAHSSPPSGKTASPKILFSKKFGNDPISIILPEQPCSRRQRFVSSPLLQAFLQSWEIRPQALQKPMLPELTQGESSVLLPFP